MSIRKAVFPIAGLGTRMLPATKALPKEMLPVVDKPVIHYALEEAKEAGIEEFIFVTGRGKGLIEDHFDVSYELFETLRKKQKVEALAQLQSWLPEAGSVMFTRQQEPLGLGHAVWCARHMVGDEPFAVILVDDLMTGEKGCTRQLVDAHGQLGGGCVVAVEEVPVEHTERYGIVKPGRDNGRTVEIAGMVEKPKPEVAPSNLSIMGRYILTPEIFDLLEKGERGAGGEIQLTDAMAKMIGTTPFNGVRFKGKRFDCGNKIGYVEATIAMALKNPELADETRSLMRDYLAEQASMMANTVEAA